MFDSIANPTPIPLNFRPSEQGLVGWAPPPQMDNAAMVRMCMENQKNMLVMQEKRDNTMLIMQQQSEQRQGVLLQNLAKMVGDKLDGVRGEVSAVRGEVDELREDFETSKFKEGLRRSILPSLGALVNTEKGWAAWQAHGFTHSDTEYGEYVVINVAMMGQFYSKEHPSALNKEDVETFFRTTSNFPRPRKYFLFPDLISLIVKCGYRHLSVGPKGNSMEAETRKRFVITPADSFKKTLVDTRRVFAGELENRDPDWGGSKIKYNTFSETYAYTSISKDDESTDYLVPTRRSMDRNEVSKIPAGGYPWTLGCFTPMMRDFFGMPPAGLAGSGAAGNHHVVNGRFKPDSLEVKSYEQAVDNILQEKKEKAREVREKARESRKKRGVSSVAEKTTRRCKK